MLHFKCRANVQSTLWIDIVYTQITRVEQSLTEQQGFEPATLRFLFDVPGGGPMRLSDVGFLG